MEGMGFFVLLDSMNANCHADNKKGLLMCPQSCIVGMGGGGAGCVRVGRGWSAQMPAR